MAVPPIVAERESVSTYRWTCTTRVAAKRKYNWNPGMTAPGWTRKYKANHKFIARYLAYVRRCPELRWRDWLYIRFGSTTGGNGGLNGLTQHPHETTLPSLSLQRKFRAIQSTGTIRVCLWSGEYPKQQVSAGKRYLNRWLRLSLAIGQAVLPVIDVQRLLTLCLFSWLKTIFVR